MGIPGLLALEFLASRGLCRSHWVARRLALCIARSAKHDNLCALSSRPGQSHTPTHFGAQYAILFALPRATWSREGLSQRPLSPRGSGASYPAQTQVGTTSLAIPQERAALCGRRFGSGTKDAEIVNRVEACPPAHRVIAPERRGTNPNSPPQIGQWAGTRLKCSATSVTKRAAKTQFSNVAESVRRTDSVTFARRLWSVIYPVPLP